jgi:hypothetical protein
MDRIGNCGMQIADCGTENKDVGRHQSAFRIPQLLFILSIPVNLRPRSSGRFSFCEGLFAT